MRYEGRLAGLFLLLLVLAGFAPPRQLPPGAITMTVDAGFDGSFREDEWLPVYVRLSNDGPDIEGSLIVRPETSINAVSNRYSVPISLPQGSRKAAFLYITARAFASQIRVELIDTSGVVMAAQPAPLRSLQTRDQLHVVVSQSATGVVDLTGVHDGGYSAFQAIWQTENIPERAAALNSVDLMLFSDVDSGALSSGQRSALADWVTGGGHLIVTGGTNWQGTAAGLGDLLPLLPDNSTTLDDLSPLGEWLRFSAGDLARQTVIATGDLIDGAETLVSAGDLPLLARRTLGAGTVDYLAADPNAQPLRGWAGLSELWLTLATTVGSFPSWGYGINNWSDATTGVNILPGIDLLPDILPLCGFLAIYIALIGPLNYIVLNRFNRRELAWITIPVFIIIFSALAWIVGFNLRGNEVTVSRLTLVESWPDAERARVQEVIGLLSPRRAQYSLTVLDDGVLRPIPRQSQGAFFTGNVQSSTDIQQAEVFRADNFSVDASFIAAFTTNGMREKPLVSGRATLTHTGESSSQVMRGSVRNDSDQTLNNPVILVRGQVYRLEAALEPGDVAPFDVLLPGEGLPAPAPLAFAPGGFSSLYFRSSIYRNTAPQTLLDVLGQDVTTRQSFYPGAGSTVTEQEAYRRRMFLSAFVNDPYDVITGRGNNAYLAAWSETAPSNIELEGANWRSIDTTLYIIKLEI